MNGRRRQQGQRGVTLVEMLIAMSVLAIAAAVAAPNAPRLLSQYQFASATNLVVFEIARAHMQAIAQNQAVRVAIDSSGRAICRQTGPGLSGPWTPGSCSTASDAVDLPGNTVAFGGFPTFGRAGIAQAASTIQLTDADHHRVLNVNILGRVTIE